MPTNRWDAFYTVEGVIDVLGAGSLTVTRNGSVELLGCHWFAVVHRQNHTPISIPLPTEWSIRQIGIKKHPFTALLKYSPAVLKSSILSCWQALRLDLSRHALLVVGVVRYTMRNKRTPTHQYGIRVQESMSNHITDLQTAGAKESKNAPLSFTEQATDKEC